MGLSTKMAKANEAEPRVTQSSDLSLLLPLVVMALHLLYHRAKPVQE